MMDVYCNILIFKIFLPIADSTNYLHIAGRSTNNAVDYINATMLAVSIWEKKCTSSNVGSDLPNVHPYK